MRLPPSVENILININIIIIIAIVIWCFRFRCKCEMIWWGSSETLTSRKQFFAERGFYCYLQIHKNCTVLERPQKMTTILKSLLLLLFLCVEITTNTVNINNEKSQSYASFPRWTDTTDGEGSIEFKFKTHKSNGLLLYADGGFGTKNFEFRMALSGGQINVDFKMGCDEDPCVKSTIIGSQWNDLRWHHVKVIRNYRQVNIWVDNQEKMLSSDGHVDRLKLHSEIIMGFHTDNLYEG